MQRTKKAGKKKKASKKKAVKKKPAKKKQAKKKQATKKQTKKKAAARKAVRKKAAAGKKTAKKKSKKSGKAAVKRAVRRKPARTARPAEMTLVPKSGGRAPVNESQASSEEAIGVVTHYYSHLAVAIVQVNKGEIRTGDTIHIKGHTTDLTQDVESMEYEHQHVEAASAGMSVGIRVKDHTREHDIVYKKL